MASTEETELPQIFLDRRALYKDLIILKQVLPNKIALNKDLNCKLPCIIERYKQASFDIV